MLRRHTLAWIEPAAGQRFLASLEPETRAAVGEWLANEWPLCARRPDIAEAPEEPRVALGLPLPPSQGKRRLKFVADRADVAHTAKPLPLRAIVARAPDYLRAYLDALDERAHDRAVTLRVYGSFAWQALTSWTYVTPQSDLDLLVAPADARALDAAIALLTGEESMAPVRLDGEIVFPDGDAVSWREWRASDREARVLVKRTRDIALTRHGALRAQLEDRVPV